jgi:membrane-associated protein
MTALLAQLVWHRLALGAGFAFAESALGLGVLLPGEIAISGVAVGVSGPVGLLSLVLAVALGASAGDHVGYALGRRFGPRFGESRLVRRVGVERWERASAMVRRWGALAVLVSRILPFVRTVLPAVAGAGGLTYRRFLPASLVGGLAWAGLWVGAGASVAASGILDHRAWLAGGVVTAVALAVTARLACRIARDRGTACQVRTLGHRGAAVGALGTASPDLDEAAA